MVLRVLVDQAHAVFVQAVVEFFVDGVECHDCAERKSDAELEEEVWVAKERFIDVERLRAEIWGDRARGWVGCAESTRRRRRFEAPGVCCDVAASVLMAAYYAWCIRVVRWKTEGAGGG